MTLDPAVIAVLMLLAAVAAPAPAVWLADRLAPLFPLGTDETPAPPPFQGMTNAWIVRITLSVAIIFAMAMTYGWAAYLAGWLG